MALIWADGFTGDKALAPAWRELALATARQKAATTNDPGEFVAAAKALETAQSRYAALVAEATQALNVLGQQGQGRTHVLIVGVGQYDSSEVTAVTTSVHGARAFAEWVLTRFKKSDRPLGSVELLCSPTPGQGDWTPLAAAADNLGFGATPLAIPDEAATFDNIHEAFKRLLARAETCADNALIWYFAGHGLFKSESLLLPQDAQLPTDTRPAENLIAPTTTLAYLQNRRPSLQCFFIDACSETNLELIYNVEQQPGTPLCKPTNGAAIPGRDATVYFGSYPGSKAYGPADGAPFFTQELISCLDRRAGDTRYGASQVSLASLSTALKAAATYRAEIENNVNITFTDTKPGVSSGYGQLCELQGPVEVLVQVRCLLKEAMPSAKLYVVDAGGNRVSRAAPRSGDWCTPVRKGPWTASADFDPPATFQCDPFPFDPVPPVMEIPVKVR